MTTEEVIDDYERARRSGFGNPDVAFRLREAFRAIAFEEIGKLGSNVKVGRCITFDLGKLHASVWIPGDPEPIDVRLFPDIIPNDTDDTRSVSGYMSTSTIGSGAVVIVEDVRDQPYITRVLTGGHFAYKLSPAGIQHKLFRAVHRTASEVEPDNVPTVKSVHGTAMSFFAQGDAEYGDAVMVGPFTGVSTGQLHTGTLKISVSQSQDSYEFEFPWSYDGIFDNSLYTAGTAPSEKWMRVLPKHRSSWNGTSPREINLDIGYRATNYRSNLNREFWLRFSTAIPGDFVDSISVHVQSNGPILNFGEYSTGKILVETQSPITAINGVLGLHQPSGSNDGSNGFRMRDDYTNRANAAAGPEPRYGGEHIDTGPWMDSSLTLARDVFRTWGCNGYFDWDGSGILWTGDLVFTGVGPSIQGLVEGRLNLPMPINGTKIGIHPSNPFSAMNLVTSTVASGRIPLAAGQTLCAIIPNYTGNGGVAGYHNWGDKNYWFMIIDNETFDAPDKNFKLPPWVIPLVHRGYSVTDPNEIKVTSPNVELWDKTQYASVFDTTGTIAVPTAEAVLITLPTINIKDKCAYRIQFRSHYFSSATTSRINFKLRKGTSAAGTQYGDFGNWTVNVTGQAHLAFYEGYLYNVSGAAISGQWNITHVSNAAGASVFASAISKRFFHIEYCGPADKYVNVGLPVT